MCSILNNLPRVKGILQENVSLASKSWFGVGGPAEVLFIPESMDDLVVFLRSVPKDINITILGALSNVLIRSGGVKGVVVSLGEWFDRIFIEDNILEVGAAVRCSRLSTVALDNELGGFEFLISLPGTVGGAVKMNAGCYGSDMSQVLIECEAVSTSGMVRWLSLKDFDFSYRKANVPSDLIITRVWFRGNKNVDYSIPKKTNEIMRQRLKDQPSSKKSCGSAFKNPSGYKAWQLIEEAGCRGLKRGGAKISDKHCNFIINDDDATPEDVENLGEEVRRLVFEKTGVELEWEIIRLGEKLV